MIKNQIINICNSLLAVPQIRILEKESHYRIDGILYDKDKNLLMIITDRYIIKYKYEINTFIIENKILIAHIDYITLTRDHNYMILHLVEEANQDNLAIANKNLHRVVGCLCSTFFYDKHDYTYPKDRMVERKTPVILVNQKMTDLIHTLKTATEFCHYRDEFNDFLSVRLKRLKIDIDNYVYTCINYRIVKEEAIFIQADFVLDLHAIYIVEFIKDKFETLFTLYLKNIKGMKTIKSSHSFIIYDSVFPEGFEIKLNNYLAVQALIASNVQVYNSLTV